MYSYTSLNFIRKGYKYHKLKFVFRLSEIKDLIKFRLFNLEASTMNYFGTNIDTFLIGKILGMNDTGIFFLVKRLVLYPSMIINPIITKVLTPVLAIYQDNLDKVKELYLKTINFLSSINF